MVRDNRPGTWGDRRRAMLTRRELLRAAGTGLSAAGAMMLVGCGGSGAKQALAEAPEVTTIRFAKDYSICLAPQYVAREFLLEEGFTDVQYVIQSRLSDFNGAIASGEVDMSMNFAAPVVASIDEGKEIVALGGVHTGCIELFVQDHITSVDDLRGKRIAVNQTQPTAADFAFVENLLHYVGISAAFDVELVIGPVHESVLKFSKGEVDAVLSNPPIGEQLRTFGAGYVLANSGEHRPWSQYFCCLPVVGRAFMEQNPIATRRALRALLRGADLCASEPERVAAYLVENLFTTNYEHALASMKLVKYGHWRDLNPEDSLRYYALRLHEAGTIKGTPDEIIQRGTDWRFFNELKEEMAFAPGFRPPPSDFAFNCAVTPEMPAGV